MWEKKWFVTADLSKKGRKLKQFDDICVSKINHNQMKSPTVEGEKGSRQVKRDQTSTRLLLAFLNNHFLKIPSLILLRQWSKDQQQISCHSSTTDLYVYTALLTKTFSLMLLHLHNSDNKSLVICLKGSRLKIDMQKLSRQWHLTMSVNVNCQPEKHKEEGGKAKSIMRQR